MKVRKDELFDMNVLKRHIYAYFYEHFNILRDVYTFNDLALSFFASHSISMWDSI